jgi:hypothetical protein
VSKVGSPSHTHAVGEVLIENRGPEGRIRATMVSHRRGTGRATGVVRSHPLTNQRPRLEPTIPLRFIKILPLI